MPDRASSTVVRASAGFLSGSPAAAGPDGRDRRWELAGTPDQVRHARRLLADMLGDWPRGDDAVLVVSELAANAVRHSRSGEPGGRFTIHAQISSSSSLLIEVRDQGGSWRPGNRDDEQGRGLRIVGDLADAFWVQGDPVTGWVVSAILVLPDDAAAAATGAESHDSGDWPGHPDWLAEVRS